MRAGTRLQRDSSRELVSSTAYCVSLLPRHHSSVQVIPNTQRLVEWVGSCAPVGEEQAQANSLEDAGNNTNGNGIHWSLLSDNLGDDLYHVSILESMPECRKTYTWGSRGKEDQASQVGSTLVAEGSGGINQSGNTVGLDGRANERGTPAGSSGGSLSGLEEFLLAVGGLGTLVCISEQRSEDGES